MGEKRKVENKRVGKKEKGMQYCDNKKLRRSSQKRENENKRRRKWKRKENEYEKKEEDDGVKNTVRYIMTERFFSNCEIFLS